MATTTIKRLYQGTNEFVPITLTEAVVVNTDGWNLGTNKITTLDVVLRKLLSELASQSEDINNHETSVEQALSSINAALQKKQDVLKAGVGITIQNGEISCTSNIELYEVLANAEALTNLKNSNSAKTNKIYLVPVGTGSNSFSEFIYVNGNWEQIGTISSSVDLSGYVSKTEYNNKMQVVDGKISKIESDISTINTTLSNLNVSNAITAKDITFSTNESIKIVVNYDIPTNLYDDMVSSNNDYVTGLR